MGRTLRSQALLEPRPLPVKLRPSIRRSHPDRAATSQFSPPSKPHLPSDLSSSLLSNAAPQVAQSQPKEPKTAPRNGCLQPQPLSLAPYSCSVGSYVCQLDTNPFFQCATLLGTAYPPR